MTTTGPLAIEATGLAKSFGATRAVAGIDLAVPAGAIYGVLGPNGAGKTTTIRMLATLLAPDAGSARVLGHDIVTEADAVRERISLTGQLASVDEDLTGPENLTLLGRLLGLRRAAARARADELLEAFGIADSGRKLVKQYSGGMRRRLDIAAGLVVTPRLMFLDEPTTGLDPRSRNQVWEIARALVAEGTTILLCTQYLEEADQLADGIAVIDRGRSLPIWRPAPLLGALLGDSVRYVIAGTVILVLGVVLGYRPDGGALGAVAALALVVVFSFGLSWVFSVLGLLMRSPNAVLNAGFTAIFPLAFLSNVFVQPRTLPAPLEAFVQVNPVSIFTTASRSLMAGNPRRGRHRALAHCGRGPGRRLPAVDQRSLPPPLTVRGRPRRQSGDPSPCRAAGVSAPGPRPRRARGG